MREALAKREWARSSKGIHISLAIISKMKKRDEGGEAPLVGTLRFVLVMGCTFAVLWFLMYWFILRSRW
jgi:hypothetical protein